MNFIKRSIIISVWMNIKVVKFFNTKINIIHALSRYAPVGDKLQILSIWLITLPSSLRIEKGSDITQWWRTCIACVKPWFQCHTLSKKKWTEKSKDRCKIKQSNRKIHSLKYCSGCSNFFRLWAPLFTYKEQNSARAQLEFSGSKGLKSLSSCKPAPGLQRKSLRTLRCSICGRLLSHRKKKIARWNTPQRAWRIGESFERIS